MNDRQQADFNFKDIAKTVVDYSVDIGFEYTLMTVGDKRIDPWVISQFCLSLDPNFSPLIAVNPSYQHPVSVVKKLISLKNLYPSNVAINLVTGSFFGELRAINDNLDFEARTNRLNEFYLSMLALISSEKSHFKGDFYQVQSAEIYPKYNFGSFDFFVSGSMTNEFKSNKQAYFVRSIRPVSEMQKAQVPNCGLSLGICARSSKEEALSEINRIYPPNRKGEMLFSISIANNLTPWNKWLKNYLDENSDEVSTYFLKPMKNFWSSAPYVVGSYQEVADQLSAYVELGYQFFILDFQPEEAIHIKKCLNLFRNR